MKYRKIDRANLDVSLLALGTMRLPVIDGNFDKIDEPKAIELIRYALDNGVNYIDTAYPYHGGNSEFVVGKALKDGYREKAILVTKNPVWNVKEYDDFEKYLDEQLEKLGVEYIDIYLLHALNKKSWENIKKLGCIKFLNEMIKKGKIKVPSFSIHDDYSLFKEVIDSYKWPIAMMQMNYMDINNQVTLKGIKYAEEKGVSIAIMEPLKGGQLANLPKSINTIFAKTKVELNPVERSFRWIANMSNVKVILSGMSTIDQLKENIKIISKLEADVISKEELEIYEEVRETLDKRVKVPCTECRYCMPCPHGVNIPGNFTQYNKSSIYEDVKGPSYVYQKLFSDKERANKCVLCGECEPKCPQNIRIMDELKNVDKALNTNIEFDSYHWSF